MWVIKSYVLDDGSDVIECWYATHPRKKRAKLAAKLTAYMLYLSQLRTTGEWNGPFFHLLKGQGPIGRIGFDYQHIAYRLIGCFGPAEDEFTFLNCAEEHDNVYKPLGCIDQASQRMTIVKANPNRARIAKLQVSNV